MTANPFEDFLQYVGKNYGEENWVTVYKDIETSDNSEDGGLYCALVSKDQTEKALNQTRWDVMIGAGGPGFCTYYEDGKSITTYYNAEEEGFLRLVLNRDFHGRENNYIEILEEFRLFHNLYFRTRDATYITFDDSGDEVEVIKTTPSEIKIRKWYLKSFIAARQMNLLLYFEVTRHFHEILSYQEEIIGNDVSYIIYSGDSYAKGYHTFSRICGKKLIRCGPMESCGVYPFKKEKEFQDFIIGGDSDDPTTFNCNPDSLANYFGANPQAPHYLTPVYFRKEVMQKYYSSSDYEINDGHLHRRGAWSLRLDNNSPTHVAVFLGDLGTDLPEKEQIYWKSFNVAPDGRTISDANFQRSFLGNFYDADNPEHKFKNKYERLQKEWQEHYGWSLFLPLSDKDNHFIKSIRSMLTNEQSEFDGQILSLTKTINDSINVKELRKFLEITDQDIKSIGLMEELLKKLEIKDSSTHISLLRAIQSVRSTGVAHRKGTEYEKSIARLNINEEDYQTEFDQILLNMTVFFDALLAKLKTNKSV